MTGLDDPKILSCLWLLTPRKARVFKKVCFSHSFPYLCPAFKVLHILTSTFFYSLISLIPNNQTQNLCLECSPSPIPPNDSLRIL